MAKCNMGEIHSENVFLRVTYISNGPKELLRKWFIAYLLDVKVLVHALVLLTSFHIFSISLNLAKLKLYMSVQDDFSIKVLRFTSKCFLIFRSW